MPKAPHFRVTFEGVLGSVAAPLEKWQFGLNVAAPLVLLDGAGLPAELLGYANTCYTGVAGTLLGNVGSWLRLTACDIRYIAANGLQPRNAAGGFSGAARYESDQAGSMSSAVRYPPQVSLVVSLQTARAGARGKGRFFLPAPGYVLQDDSRLSVAHATGMANVGAAIVNTVNSAFPPAYGKVSVMSSFGFSSEVTSIRVGRTLDTHRSRRSDLIEAYIVAPVAP